MVTFQERLFLIAGPHFAGRQEALETIKKKFFTARSAFDLLTFYASEIELKDFQEQIMTVSFEGARIVLLKNAGALPEEVKAFLTENIQKLIVSNCIVLEFEEDYQRLREDKRIAADGFFGLFLAQATAFKATGAAQVPAFEDFKNNFYRRDLTGSLYALRALFSRSPRDEELGPQVLGLLVSSCAYERNPAVRRKNLRYLWEADRAMKEKGVESQTVLTAAITKILKA